MCVLNHGGHTKEDLGIEELNTANNCARVVKSSREGENICRILLLLKKIGNARPGEGD